MLKFKRLLPQETSNYFYWLLFTFGLVAIVIFTYIEAKFQDAELRSNLVTYVNTIEKSIDWQPYLATLNANPSQIKESDLALLNSQLNKACKVNKACHFIYLLYVDKQQVKFLLDASPQPPSEISHLGDVFEEASDALKFSFVTKKSLIEGPVTDKWGTWISARVPISATMNSPNMVLLSVDASVGTWYKHVFTSSIVPVLSTIIFLGFILVFIYQNKKREQLLTQLYRSQTELKDLANNDALTGLPNRRLLEDRMEQALKAANREKQIVAVLFLDLDFFKVVNDTQGHLIGDKLLVNVATRLLALLRAEDTVARIGGDEFVVLLTKISDIKHVIATAEKVVSEVAKPFVIDEKVLQLGVSIGIALYPDHDNNAKVLIQHADDAMYVAKRKGRNCYSIYASG